MINPSPFITEYKDAVSFMNAPTIKPKQEAIIAARNKINIIKKNCALKA
ncbi:hypothetical protein ES703_117203 [subsurface metagenome]